MDRLPLFSTLFCLLSNQLPASGFQAPRPALLHSRRHVTLTTRISAVQIDEYATRDYDSFVEWGNNYGLSQENGFQLSEQFGEWGIMAGQNAQAGSRLLFVPAMLRITSSRVRQEEFPQLEPAIAQFFDATNSKGQQNLDCQFYLFLKVLQEYEQQESSPYYAWLNALPRKFRTALTFDPFEMECLPPFVKYLAQMDLYNYEVCVLMILMLLLMFVVVGDDVSFYERDQFRFFARRDRSSCIDTIQSFIQSFSTINSYLWIRCNHWTFPLSAGRQRITRKLPNGRSTSSLLVPERPSARAK